MLTQFTPACDIDILDQEAAEACELLIRDRFGDTGSLLVRFGLRPKRMMLFQTAKAFKKIAVALIAANGDTRQKIEFMCDGQQVVVDGIHPDTRQPYEWVGGVLGDIKRVDLPCINEAEAKALVRDLVELLIAEHGYKIAPGSAALPVTNGHDDEYEPLIQPRADDWLLLINNILDGASLHDSVRDLAAKLVAGGMKGGATVNLVRGLLAQSRTPRDDRYYDRLHEIPGLVSSAERKFADSEYTEADPPKKIELLSSAAFVASYVPPDFLIDDLLQRQFFYSLTGKTGAGKTAIALMIAVLVALARDLDGRQSERGRVLYLAGENPVDVRQRWIAMSQQMDFDYNTIDVHFIPGVFKVSDMQAEIATQVERLGGVALVIIDTSAAYFEGDDENNNVQAGQYARMQRSLITSLPGGPTILALCHPVKNATDDNLLPRGGGAYLNETDGNLTAQNDDGVAKLHWQGKFAGPISRRYRFNFARSRTKCSRTPRDERSLRWWQAICPMRRRKSSVMLLWAGRTRRCASSRKTTATFPTRIWPNMPA